MLAERGRSADGFPIQVRLHVDAGDLDAGAWRERVGAYSDAGVTELVLAPQTRDGAAQRRWLETLLPVLVKAAGA